MISVRSLTLEWRLVSIYEKRKELSSLSIQTFYGRAFCSVLCRVYTRAPWANCVRYTHSDLHTLSFLSDPCIGRGVTHTIVSLRVSQPASLPAIQLIPVATVRPRHTWSINYMDGGQHLLQNTELCLKMGGERFVFMPVCLSISGLLKTKKKSLFTSRQNCSPKAKKFIFPFQVCFCAASTLFVLSAVFQLCYNDPVNTLQWCFMRKMVFCPQGTFFCVLNVLCHCY